jgi:DNA-binding transcriptional MerR regulator
MSTLNSSALVIPPAIKLDSGATYSLDILAQLSGVSTETILHYHEEGLIKSVPVAGSDAVVVEPRFDDDSVRMLRILEALRDTCAVNLLGMKLFVELQDEIEHLRAELRAIR